VAKSFRPPYTLAAFAVLAVLSSVALIMGGNVTPYAAETPPIAGSAPVPPTSPTPSSAPPTSASRQSSTRPAGTRSSTPPSRKDATGEGKTDPPTFIPPDAMLSAGDIGPGVTGNEERVDDHGSLGATLGYCGQTPASWRQRVDTLGFRQRWLRYPDETYTVQELSRQPAAVAAKLVPDLRAMFGGPCATVAIGGDSEVTSTFTIFASDWGDESLLMSETRAGAPVAWRIAIRQGALFTEIRVSLDGFAEGQARELGRRAAQRLCLATPTC
jgi:hypothetical protein